MTARKEFIIALLAAFIIFVIGVAYNLSMLEIRIGQIEHFLAHQGFFESYCYK